LQGVRAGWVVQTKNKKNNKEKEKRWTGSIGKSGGATNGQLGKGYNKSTKKEKNKNQCPTGARARAF